MNPLSQTVFLDLSQALAKIPFLEVDRAIAHYLREMGTLLGAHSATWIGSGLDKDVSAIPAMETINGWFVIDFMTIELETPRLSQEELYQLYFQLAQEHGVDPLTKKAVGEAGQLRGHIRSESYDDEAWAEHWHRKDYLEKMGVSEGMVVGVPVDAQAECYHTYQRSEGAQPFSQEEKEFAMRGAASIAWLHRRLMSLRGGLLPQKKMLSPQEKIILLEVLGGLQEKEIAEKMELTKATVHSHITSIFRKFGVSGKSGLVAQIMTQ